MIRRTAIAIALLLAVRSLSWADDELSNELKNDVVLRALVDELHRNKERLKLTGLAEPYFIEYALTDNTRASFTARLGAVTSQYSYRTRGFRADVRVGSYQLDNTNFEGDYSDYGSGSSISMNVPIEDHYAALRQAMWWASDRDYKSVTEVLERKKAFMASKMIEDKPDDFSREAPTVHFEERKQPDVALPDLEKIALPLSALFRKYPAVQNSYVTIGAGGGNRYIVNTEGTTIRFFGELYALNVYATVQADDGMPFYDSFILYSRDLAGLPSPDELTARTKKMIEQLVQVSRAPKLESYTGPVLFDGKAAAQVFAQQFSYRFCGGQRPVGGSAPSDDFEKKLGLRVLPKFMSVVDDPSRETIDGEIVLGHYEYDDQGVKVEPIQLVEKGRLKTLLMSRNPSKKIGKSNGHGRGAYGPSSAVGCLIARADDGDDDASLKQQLLEACQEEDLPFGLRISSLESSNVPLVMYKVFPDGREELVGAAEISRLELKAFKKILAAGRKLYVVNEGGLQGRTIAAPALLFEELDLAKIDQDFDKPPIIESPLARKG